MIFNYLIQIIFDGHTKSVAYNEHLSFIYASAGLDCWYTMQPQNSITKWTNLPSNSNDRSITYGMVIPSCALLPKLHCTFLNHHSHWLLLYSGHSNKKLFNHFIQNTSCYINRCMHSRLIQNTYAKAISSRNFYGQVTTINFGFVIVALTKLLILPSFSQ